MVTRARDILRTLEKGERSGGVRAAALLDDLPLFSAAARPEATPAPSAVEARLADIRPDDLSPREALALVYELRQLLENGAE